MITKWLNSDRSTTMSGSAFGFTLLELLVVILIMSISMGLFLGLNYGQKESVQLKAAGRELAQLFKTAKSYALLQGKKNKCLYLSEENIIKDELRGKKVSLSEKIVISSVNTSNDEPIALATFYPDGSAQAEKITLKSGSKTINIKIDPLLGQVKIE